jgi:hypothetical protein
MLYSGVDIFARGGWLPSLIPFASWTQAGVGTGKVEPLAEPTTVPTPAPRSYHDDQVDS